MKHIYRIFKTQLLLAVVLLSAVHGLAQNPTVTVPTGCKVVQIGTGGNFPSAVGVLPVIPGRVGDGGIVTMTDPYAGGSFTFNPNNTTSPLVTNAVGSWTLSGDLSTSTLSTNLFDTPTVIGGTPLTATIKSYNKKLRIPSENTAPSINSWARSKGRVVIQYTKTTSTTGTGCGNSITFDVFKVFAPTVLLNPTNILVQPTNVPKIIGPRCVVPGGTYTYSVDQIVSDNLTDGIGLDNYYWTLVASTPLTGYTSYTSADKSSITITIPLTTSTTPFIPFTLKCCYGRSNPWDGNLSAIPTTCVSLGIVQELQQPKVTIPCVKTGDTSFSATVDPGYVTANAGSNTTYTLATVGSNWTLTNPTSPNLIGTLPATDNNPCTLTLTVNNNICTPASVYTVTVWRDFVAPFAIDSYPTPRFTTCLTPNATLPTTLQYSLPASGLDNITTWSITPTNANGLTIISTANTTGSIVNISMPNETTAAAGAYELTAFPKNCSSPISIILNVQPKAPVGLAGLTCVQRNGGGAVTYTCTAVTGATSYIWTIPAGWTTTAANNTTLTPTISVTPGGNGTTGNFITVAAMVNDCQGPASAKYYINYNAVAPTSVTLSSTCIPAGIPSLQSITFSNAKNYGTYALSCNLAGFIDTITPTVTINTTTGVGTITYRSTGIIGTNIIFTITHSSVLPAPPATQTPLCGTATGSSTAISVVASTTAVWATNYPQYDPVVGGCDNFRVAPQPVIAGVSYNYAWYIKPFPATLTALTPLVSSGFITISPSGNQLQLCGSVLPTGDIVCVITPSAGCGTALTGTAGNHGVARNANTTSNGIKSIEAVVVYPNPNNGTFLIKLDKNTVNAKATLYDLSGKELAVYVLKKGDNKVEKAGLASGSYNLLLEVDGKTESRQIIIK